MVEKSTAWCVIQEKKPENAKFVEQAFHSKLIVSWIHCLFGCKIKGVETGNISEFSV